MSRWSLKVVTIAGIVLIGAATAHPNAGLAANRYAGRWQTLSRGGRVRIENQSGPITVVGWDQDTVEASVEGQERDSVRVQEEQPGLVTITTNVPGHPHGEVHLRINLPRLAGIESLNTGRGNVEVTDVEGPVSVNSRNGNLTIRNTGAVSAFTANGEIQVRSVTGDAKLQTRSGEVNVSQVSGRVNIQTSNGGVRANNTGALSVHTDSGEITAGSVNGNATLESNNGDVVVKEVRGDLVAKVTSGGLRLENIGGVISAAIASGDVTITNAGADVKVSSISSDLNLKCVKGAVDVSSVSGSITLAGVGGDVNAVTTSGEVTLSGNIRPRGHYRLKSVSGEVTFLTQSDPPGFTATLSSYSGEIETDFPIKLDSPLEHGPVNRRIIGRYGDGQADITLDSFSGTAKLGKLPGGKSPSCN